jgi:hypothetical protein
MMVDDSFNANLYTWICGTIAQQLDSVVLLLFIYLLTLQSYKIITMIEGMVNRTWVPCEDQPDTNQ